MAAHGRYTIMSKLADGGMAEIFLALQHGAEGFQKPVVLKRIHTAFSADPQFRNMFLDEAHISMSLNHSSIVQVLDLGVSNGRYFLALEMVDGWDLDRILRRAKAASMIWPPALSLYVVAEVCRALSYAHGKLQNGKPLGIVHRDISPNNVLISEQGEIKLADFGIAKAQRKREQTAAGVIKGKIAFMSPEQALGSTIDRRSDLFSVGSMLYLMATDKLPFESATDHEAIVKVQKAAFLPPETAHPGVGAEVSRIIMRAMRLAPTERYQTADEMLADIERVLRTEYQSAGQTELKSWLQQLGRRDGAQSIGKTRARSAPVVPVVKEGGTPGTDLNVGTSFELDDLDIVSGLTDETFAPGAIIQAGAPPPPPPLPDGARAAAQPPPPPLPPPAAVDSSGAVRGRKGRGLRGFWLGATFALAAVIGVRYLIEWARTQPLFGVNPVVPEAEPPAHRSAIPAGGPTIERELAPPAPVAPAVPSAPASPAAPPPTVPNSAPSASPSASPSPSPASGAGGAAAAEAVPAAPVTHPPAPTAAAPDAGAPAVAVGDSAKGKGESAPAPNAGGEPAEQEPDEEALLRNAVPDAESAVIGEEEAEETAKAGTGTPGAPSRPVAKPKGAPKAAAHATASATPHVETVSVHITSTPVGAVVRTKHKVLGRTPINLHFRGDNIYELMFIKQGYAQATKRLTISGPSSRDRKLSVALKKNPTGVRRTGLFHMHR